MLCCNVIEFYSQIYINKRVCISLISKSIVTHYYKIGRV